MRGGADDERGYMKDKEIRGIKEIILLVEKPVFWMNIKINP